METSEEVEELLELLVELLEEEELLEELEVVLKLLEVVVFEELEELEGVEELEEELEDAELEVEDIAVQTLLPSRSCVFGGHTQRVPVVRVRILLPGQGASEVEEETELAILDEELLVVEVEVLEVLEEEDMTTTGGSVSTVQVI